LLIIGTIFLLVNYVLNKKFYEGFSTKEAVQNVASIYDKENLKVSNANITKKLDVKGNSTIEGNQTINGDNTIKKNNIINGNNTVKEDNTVNKNNTVKGNNTIYGKNIIKGSNEVRGNGNYKKNITINGKLCMDDFCLEKKHLKKIFEVIYGKKPISLYSPRVNRCIDTKKHGKWKRGCRRHKSKIYVRAFK
jgi:NDP-sugar pyrophosphorylase family protein